MTDNKLIDLDTQVRASQSDNDTISIADIIVNLARNIKIIIIIPIVFCVITIIYVLFIAQPVYVSSAKIMSSSGTKVSKVAGLASQFGIELPTGQSEPNWVYDDIIKSRTLARSMLNRKFDTDEFGKQKSLLQILTYGNEPPEYGLDTLEILAVETFLSMITLSRDMETSIYTLDLSSSEPKFSAHLNASLIEELDTHQREYNKAITSKTRQFIEGRIIKTKKELEAMEEVLRDFTDRNRRIENSPLLLLEQQRLDREVSVLTGVYTTLKQQLETTKIEEVKESQYVIVLDPPEIPLKRSSPNRKAMVILAGFLGLGLGIIVGLFIEYVENSDDSEKKKMKLAKLIFVKNIIAFFPNAFREKT